VGYSKVGGRLLVRQTSREKVAEVFNNAFLRFDMN